MYLPHGAFAPVPTPLTTDGSVDAPALAAHLKWLKAEGLEGALVLGTNGEFASLTMAEKITTAEAAASAASGLRLLLNVGDCALPSVLELSALAARLGYDAILCPPPWYYRNAGVPGLAAFMRQVLDASSLPVLLYHIPQLTGVPISDELLDAMGPHERLVGIKDSTGDEAEMQRLLPRFKCYLVGHDKLVARCLQAGGHGSISACASVVPDLVARIASQPDQQGKLNSLRGLLEKFGLGASVKAILSKKGFGAYATRPPQTALTEDEAKSLLAMLDMFGAIKW